MMRPAATCVAVTGFVCAVCLSAPGRLSGQVVIVQSAPPAAAGLALPAPPPPIDAAPLPSFEVASVQTIPKNAKITSSGIRTPGGGRITITNYPLRSIIMLAWGSIRDYQIIDAPGWLTTERFTINAKAETNAPRDQLLLMLRSLVMERFNLKFRAEKRELPMYAMVLARSDWKPSERMRPCALPAPKPLPVAASPQPTPPSGSAPAAPGAPPPGAAPAGPPPQTGAPPQPAQKPPPAPATPAAPAAPGLPPCGATLASGVASSLTLTGTPATLASLLGSLGGLGTVHDRTGLTGVYQFQLDSSIISGRLMAAMPTSGDSLQLPDVSSGPSMGAVLEDLGLKLERRREPIDVMVIESVSRPDED